MAAATASGAYLKPENVRLNRPFVYAVIDNTINLPVFIGTIMTV